MLDHRAWGSAGGRPRGLRVHGRPGADRGADQRPGDGDQQGRRPAGWRKAMGFREPRGRAAVDRGGQERPVAQALGSSSPGEVLAQVNETLVARIPSNMFVTCFYAVLDPAGGHLSYANAGHDLPYLWNGGDCEELRARGMPLGLMSGMDYEEKEMVLDVGDSALLYRDGLVEAHDPEREMFGFPRLQALVAKHGDEEEALGDLLMEELHSFVGEGWEQEDDITLLTLRRSASLS